MSSDKLHYVCARAIIVRNGKFLIAKRSPREKVSPGKWTTPGGKLETSDYEKRPLDTYNAWYNVLEDLLRREVMEETGLVIKNIRYLTSLSFFSPDGSPYVVVSFFTESDAGAVRLCPDLTEYAWVTLEEARKYDLIDGIYEELVMADSYMKGNPVESWRRAHE